MIHIHFLYAHMTDSCHSETLKFSFQDTIFHCKTLSTHSICELLLLICHTGINLDNVMKTERDNSVSYCVCVGSTGTRTMWAWWRWKMAQWCLRTTPKALCFWGSGLRETQLRMSSTLSTSHFGWVTNWMSQTSTGKLTSKWGKVCSVTCTISFCILFFQSDLCGLHVILHSLTSPLHSALLLVSRL